MEVANRPIRVQSIAQSGAAPQVPPEYIQRPETRPNNSTARLANNNPIPSIDLSSAVRDTDFLRTKIGAAYREWGAFHVTNHGVPPKLLNEIKRMGCTFFETCPMDEKLWNPEANSNDRRSPGRVLALEGPTGEEIERTEKSSTEMANKQVKKDRIHANTEATR
ncbi:hypothetical protein RJ640_018702 [Escallonia rubra]|uniref:Non-haem dioxygenase N-terminal domain-containing protein n=1 Tax=Escallonia rubra TaxID=112253 RepID=A0AA88RMW1_9ASTE|nr:hypothetical protein RJ640_018702 [Escallonia rubra]